MFEPSAPSFKMMFKAASTNCNSLQFSLLSSDAITPLCINLFIHLVAFDFNAGRAKNVKSSLLVFPQEDTLLLKELNHYSHTLNRIIILPNLFQALFALMQRQFIVLAELYNFMEELQSTQTQQALLHYQDGKLVEEALSGSVTLLDACGSSRDLLRGDSSIVESSVSAYESFRKKAKKEITKQLGMLKKMECNKDSSISSLLGQDQNLVFFARVLRESRTITTSIFCSLLLFSQHLEQKVIFDLKVEAKKIGFFFFKQQNKNNDGVVADLNIALCSLLGREKNGGDSIKSEAQGALRVLRDTKC
ncbi:hypothetical protein Ahy_A07g032774 isoform K [Arachis hypogaea]|uniref:Uncharacterized protein n=1 Tax=Arachis hypogaea TaxID=3818 RepID=A0A445C7K4_ARAHY|nr:hypothetical protein Ahy_A07g032774 isoform K [Arachis hypogaea]